MLKKVMPAALVLSFLVIMVGCSSVETETSAPANVNIVRESKISSGWTVKQMEISLESETQIVVILSPGDKVDGYFYCVSGDNVTFSIAGNSDIYTSAGQEQGVDSDRFSFTASQSQGIAYILKLKPVKSEDKTYAAATVFFELIYPAGGEVSMPIGTK